MSCLSLDELSLSEQAAVVGSFTAACERKLNALHSVSWLSPPPAVAPRLAAVTASPGALAAGGSHTSLPNAENTAMVEQQLKEHPPLQICHPGHRPRMYRATGNCKVQFYVECSICGVRSQRADTADLAATAWARRFVEPIKGTADHTHAMAFA